MDVLENENVYRISKKKYVECMTQKSLDCRYNLEASIKKYENEMLEDI